MSLPVAVRQKAEKILQDFVAAFGVSTATPVATTPVARSTSDPGLWDDSATNEFSTYVKTVTAPIVIEDVPEDWESISS